MTDTTTSIVPDDVSQAYDDEFYENFTSKVRQAVSSGDPALMTEVFHPEMTVWETTDRVTRHAADTAQFHHALAEEIDKLELLAPRLTPLASGYVEQHVKRLTTKDGGIYEVPACLVIELEGGRIRKAREYLDSAGLPPIIAALRARLLPN